MCETKHGTEAIVEFLEETDAEILPGDIVRAVAQLHGTESEQFAALKREIERIE